MNERGILVGGNEMQEWMLPWWWENCMRHNDYPVTFADFGLSPSAQKWCQERGQILNFRLPPLFLKEREGVDETLRDKWENFYSTAFWDSREAWFKKPTACLSSPYDTTIWLDLDCQVVGPLEPLFEACASHGIAMAKDITASKREPFPVYNSGVIVFQKRAPLLTLWEKDAFEKNHLFRGDQDVLAQTIRESGASVHEIPSIYNWSRFMGESAGVVIYHWLGSVMKASLRETLLLE